jgi:hypothetical protein
VQLAGGMLLDDIGMARGRSRLGAARLARLVEIALFSICLKCPGVHSLCSSLLCRQTLIGKTIQSSRGSGAGFCRAARNHA